MMEKLADIGVFGGSGFYKFLEDIKEVKIETHPDSSYAA